MKKIKSNSKIVLGVLFFIIASILFIGNRIMIIHITYDIDGCSINYESQIPPDINKGDGSILFWGSGEILKYEKRFIGFWINKPECHIHDVCEAENLTNLYSYNVHFLSGFKWIRNETIHCHITYESDSDFHSIIECEQSQNIHVEDCGSIVFCSISR